MDNPVNWWEKFLDSIATSGGQLFVGFLVLYTGIFMHVINIPYGHEVIVSGVTLIGATMSGMTSSNQKRKERLLGNSTVTEIATQETKVSTESSDQPPK